MADPVTLLALGTAVGGLASGASALLGGKGGTPSATSVTTPPAPPPTLSPSGSSTQNPSGGQPSGQPSFLSAAAAPTQQNLATKSLLGQ
jgi:hypothetical protein